MTIVKLEVTVLPFASVAVKTIENEPEEVGVPEILPIVVSKTKPAGAVDGEKE